MKWFKKMFERIYTPKTLMEAARRARLPHEKMQVSKRQTRYTYTDGPMMFLGQQIVKSMEDAGFPAKIHCCYRSPEQQMDVYGRGNSRAKAWESPHQYMEAVDIVHPSLFWNVSADYWEQLAISTRIVAEKFGVDLTGGFDWGWDLAHIEIRDWRCLKDEPDWLDFKREEWRSVQEGIPVPEVPRDALQRRFQEVLPSVWAQYLRRK